MNRPAVTVVSHGFQPSYEKAFSNGLAKCGVDVTLIGSDRSLCDQMETSISFLNLRGSQRPQRTRAAKVANLLRYTVRLLSQLFSQRPNNLHLIGTLMTSSVLFGPLECLCYRLLSRRFIFTVHNLLPHDRHSVVNRFLFQLVYALPHTLVVHTRRMQEQLQDEWKVPASRIVHMEHGIDDLPANPRPWQPDPEGRVRLLIFGAVLRYKGVDTLLRSLDHLKGLPISLSIVGQCRDPIYREEIQQLIGRALVLHKVNWRQVYIPEDEVQEVFEQADAVVLPYRHIDQSGVLLTAYRFGIPVLAFDVGAFADYITECTGILVADSTPPGLASGIRVFSSKVRHFSRDEIRSFAKNFLWENTVAPLVRAYAS